MELEENYHHACKRSCVGNGHPAAKIGHKELQHQDEDEEDGDKNNGGWQGGAGISGGTSNCLMPWQSHPSSRIFRVSRASGGKDRHSKVYTAKGLRDRRVRLSVSTAIQFYDLQDRLGYDQPSKAIEWLIKAATAAIDELPLLDNFLRLPSQHPIDKDKPAVADPEGEPSYDQQQQHLSTKSGCSSNSETSKGSVLSLLQSENHFKKRERAWERAVKDRDEDKGGPIENSQNQRNLSSNLNTHSSFTELLTAGGGSGSNGVTVVASIAATGVDSDPICIQKQIPTADYFSQAGLFTQSQRNPQLSSSFSSPNFGHSAALGMMPFNIAAAAVAAPRYHQEMHQFSFLQDHLIPVSAAAASATATGDYNLNNFSMSSGFAGFNRGTLQSNSSSQLPHHNHKHHHSYHNHLQQRLSTPIDGSNVPLFFGAAGAVANITENPFPPGFDSRLQLYYGEGFWHSDLKEKKKS